MNEKSPQKTLNPKNIVWLFVLFVVIAFLVFFLGWGWDKFASEGIKNVATFRDFGLVIVATWGGCLAVWRSAIAQKQANTTAQQANTSAQQANTAAQQANTAARSLQNDMYQKSAEMLGSKQLSVRIGAIHALARLAQNDPLIYHYEIMEVLASFARFPKPSDSRQQAESSGALPEYRENCRPDVAKVFRAIAQRNKEQLNFDDLVAYEHGWCISLHGADLSGYVVLNYDAILCQINLINTIFVDAYLDSVDLTAAILLGADLTRTTLRNADLTDANLTDANLLNAENLTQDQLDEACQHPNGTPPRRPAIYGQVLNGTKKRPLSAGRNPTL